MTDLEQEEKLEFVKNATGQMAQATFKYICSVASVESSEIGRFVGTGFRIVHKDRRWLVTAAHVVDQANTNGSLAVTHTRGEPPVVLTTSPLFDRIHDVAVYPLPDEFDGLDAWPLAHLDSEKAHLREDFLFAHGFPGQSARFTPLLNALMAKSLPLGAMMREDDLPTDLALSQFALDYEPTNLQSVGDAPDPWQRPHGLSGSPVWRIGLLESGADDWDPSQAQLGGILTQWRPKEHLLVGSLASCLSQLLSDDRDAEK